MSRRCELTGKGPMVGNNVSHAHNKPTRGLRPNPNDATPHSATLARAHTFRTTAHALRRDAPRGGLGS